MRHRSGTMTVALISGIKMGKLIKLIRIDVLLGRERLGTNIITLKEPDILVGM